VSDTLARRLPSPLEGAESRELTLKGVAEPLAAWSLRPSPEPAKTGVPPSAD